jgi:hypothetical protein
MNKAEVTMKYKAKLFPIVLLLSLMAGLFVFPLSPVAAAPGVTQITITQVDSSAFPKVSFFATLSDESGPLDFLKSSDFSLFEDGQTSGKILSVDRPVVATDIVIAIDQSMNLDMLTKAKDVSKAFIESLPAGYQFAVLGFEDKINTIQELSGNKAVVENAIDQMAPKGVHTNLYQALFNASEILEKSKNAHAILVFSNTIDNMRAKLPDEIAAKTQQAAAPVYIVTQKDAPSRLADLQNICTRSGGLLLTYSTIDDIQGSFRTAIKWLTQGRYKITFTSNLQADNNEHDLILQLTSKGSAAQGMARYKAVANQVSLNMINMVEGQTVGGVVTLAAEVKAPATTTSVSFLVNDVLLKEVTTSPFRVDWDTTNLEAGMYKIMVQAKDKAGNKGQIALNLKVTPPVQLKVTSSATKLGYNEQATVSAEVSSLETLTQVAFILDGKQVHLAKTKPYQYVLSAKDFTPGDHLLVVRATDIQGREKEQAVSMQISPAPSVNFSWLFTPLRYIITGIATLLALFLSLLALLAIVRTQKQKLYQIRYLTLYNLGNSSTGFRVQIEELSKALTISVKLNNVLLNFQQDMRAITPQSSVGASGTRFSAPNLEKASHTASLLANFTSTLSVLLGGQAGAQAAQTTMQIRNVDRKATLTSNLGDQISDVRGERETSSNIPEPKAPEQQLIPFGAPYIVTPVVEPSQTLQLELRFDPLQPYKKRSYQVEFGSRPTSIKVEQWENETMQIDMPGLFWLWRVVPYLLFILLAAAILLLGMPYLFNLLSLYLK